MHAKRKVIISVSIISILGIVGIVVTPFMVLEFCCEYSAIWAVGGILLVIYEILGLETLIALFRMFLKYRNRG